MIVVCDTSPLNYLVLIERVEVLPAMFGRVVAPRAVIAELQHPGTPAPVREWAAGPPAWLEVRTPTSVDPGLRLGRGEAEAISLARELRADAVLIDERKAFNVARQCGLFVTGTLGVLEIAAEKGLIVLREAIAALRQTSFRVSDEIVEEVLRRDRKRALGPGRTQEQMPPGLDRPSQ
jgi:predicted nucleic acid-binding protein